MGATLIVTALLGGLIIYNGSTVNHRRLQLLDYAVGAVLVGAAAYVAVVYYLI